MNRSELIVRADYKILVAALELNRQIRMAKVAAITSLHEAADLCRQAGMTRRAAEIGSLMDAVSRDYRPQLPEHLPEDKGSAWRERAVDQWLAYAVENQEAAP